MKKILLLLGLALCHGETVFAQVRIVLLGSSTVLGSSASPADSSLASRLQKYYRQDVSAGNPDTVVLVAGNYGYTTYHELPTGTVVTVANRPAIDANANVTYALSLDPDVVIVNLPSNDVATLAQPWVTPAYSITETMDNFRTMYAAFTGAGVPTYITTTQPRNDLTMAQRQLQSDLADSIMTAFGPFAINFWDVLVTTDGTLALRDDVRNLGFPDADYHLNNTGHRLIYEQVIATDIFSTVILPLHLAAFTLSARNGGVLLSWHTESEEGDTRFEVERSVPGNPFEKLTSIDARGLSPSAYSWLDAAPPEGRSLYRLKIIEPSRTSYSRILHWMQEADGLRIRTWYVQGSSLHAQVATDAARLVTISVLNAQGAEVLRRVERCVPPSIAVELSLSALPAGQYFLRIVSGQDSDTRAFIRN